MNEFAERLMDAARQKGAEHCEVYTTESSGTGVRIMDGEVESFSDRSSFAVSVRVFKDGRLGQAYTETQGDVSVLDAALKTLELYEKPAPPLPLEAGQRYGEVERGNYDGDAHPASDKVKLALELYDACKGESEHVRSLQHCGLSVGRGRTGLYNTGGLSLEWEDGMCSIACSPVIQIGDWVQTGSAFRVSREFAKLDAAATAREAVDKALSKRDAKELKTGSYPVIIYKEAAADVLSAFSVAFNGQRALRGLSLLAGKEGSGIASALITLVDDPLMKLGYASCPFDAEGFATVRKAVVDKGVLTTLLYDRETAALAGKESTGNASRSGVGPVGIAPSNFYIQAGELSLVELAAKMGNGFVVEEVRGLHAGVNAVSGDFSLSASGAYYEGGVRAYAVENVVLAGNWFDMMKRVVGVGRDLFFDAPGGSWIGCPSLLIEELSVAGK